MGELRGRVPALLAAGGLGAAVAAWLGADVLEAANGRATDNGGGWLAVGLTVAVLTIPAVGALVAARRPGNAVGWLALASPLVIAVAVLAHAWAVNALRVHPGRPGGSAAAWAATWLFDLGLGLVPILLVVFPTGRPLRRMRVPLRVAVAALAVITVAQALAPDDLDGVAAGVAPIPNPLGVHALEPVVNVATAAGVLVLVLIALAAVVDLGRQAVRGETAEQRQLRWLVLALAALPVGAAAGAVLAAAGASAAGDTAVAAAILVAIVGSGAALAVGVLWDGMFDLRDYARRITLGAALTAVILVAFVAVVSIIATLTSASGGVPPAVAAAVVAIALGPLRGRLQRGVDRLLYGWRSEPYRVISELGDRLDATPTADSAMRVVVDTVVASLRVPYARIELHGSPDPTTVVQAGHPAVVDVERIPLVHNDRPVGALVVGRRSAEEPFRPDELRLLRNLARNAGAAARAASLTAQLQRAQADLVRSREDERRRLRRELHDGVGPALAGLGLQLDAARHSVNRSSTETAQLLAAMQSSVRSTAQEVRRIAHDLRPGVLDELGLLDAIREQVGFLAAGAGSRLDVQLDLPTTVDLPAAVEVAVYRITSEALTNVVGHAHARSCSIQLVVDNELSLKITDDGVGVPPSPSRSGLGLQSMRDRATELGGSLSVSARVPHGTFIDVVLPVQAGP